MKIHDVLTPSFRLLHRQLGHDCTGCQYAMWQQRLSSDSDFCRAVVANGYLIRQQMQRHYLQQYPQLASYMPTFCHCLFGTHLLSTSREGTEVGLFQLKSL